MISTPDILQHAAVQAAIIPIRCKREDMPSVFGPAVQDLFGVLGKQGIETLGPVFAHHLHMPPGRFVFNLGVAVVSPVTPEGRVQSGILPAGRVAHTTYTGPYEGLHGAWHAFEAWLQDNGHAKAEDLWEVYGYGPDKTLNSAEFRTELYRPLKA